MTVKCAKDCEKDNKNFGFWSHIFFFRYFGANLHFPSYMHVQYSHLSSLQFCLLLIYKSTVSEWFQSQPKTVMFTMVFTLCRKVHFNWVHNNLTMHHQHPKPRSMNWTNMLCNTVDSWSVHTLSCDFKTRFLFSHTRKSEGWIQHCWFWAMTNLIRADPRQSRSGVSPSKTTILWYVTSSVHPHTSPFPPQGETISYFKQRYTLSGVLEGRSFHFIKIF